MVVPTPPLAPATATSWPPSDAPADSSPVTRSRIVRDHCAAARTLASKDSSASGSATTSRSPACIAARISPGESSAASRIRPTSGKAAESSRARSSTGVPPSASCSSDDVDVEPAQRAVQLVGVDRRCRRPRARPRAPGRRRGARSRRRRRRSAGGRSPVTPSSPFFGSAPRKIVSPSVRSAGSPRRSSASRTSAAKTWACATRSS